MRGLLMLALALSGCVEDAPVPVVTAPPTDFGTQSAVDILGAIADRAANATELAEAFVAEMADSGG